MSWAGYPKLLRLTRRAEFDAVFDAQRSAKDGTLVVHARLNGLGRPRLGIVIGKRVRSSPARNRLKRLYREAFRLNRELLASGWDFVLVPRKTSGLTLAEATASLVKLAATVAPREEA